MAVETKRGTNGLAAGAVGCLLAVPALWALIHVVDFPLDTAARSWVGRMDYQPAAGVDALCTAIESVASAPVAAVTVVVLVTWAYRRYGVGGATTVLGVAGVVLVCALLKAAFGPAPLANANARAWGTDPVASFPSGHVAYTTAIFGLAALAAVERGRRRLAYALLLPIVLMGPARVIEGAHWPTDVLAGYLLGAGWLLGVLWLRAIVRRRALQPAG